MKITGVQAFLLSYPFPEPLRLPYHGGERLILKRDAMLIRVETDKGLTGWAPGLASEGAAAGIERVIGPFLEGRTLADADALRVRFLQQSPGLLALYCAVEIALYDLLGKAHGAPVSALLGGRARDRIRLYGSAGMYMAPERYAEEAAAIRAMGFQAYKMRPGMGPEQDLETVRQMRQAVGPDMDLMVDAHSWWRMGDRSYTAGQVETMARELREYRIAWLEEPLPPEDHEAYRRLKELDHVPLASGEHEPDEAGLIDLARSGSVDYVQMDIAGQGGYPAARRLFLEIEKSEARFAFHSWGTALEVMAAAQVGVCWPETVVEWLEYPCYGKSGMYAFPLAAEILRDPLPIVQGELVVPDTPGLGVSVDETVIDRYPWIPGPWSYFHIDSPRQDLAVSGDHNKKWAETS